MVCYSVQSGTIEERVPAMLSPRRGNVNHDVTPAARKHPNHYIHNTNNHLQPTQQLFNTQ